MITAARPREAPSRKATRQSKTTCYSWQHNQSPDVSIQQPLKSRVKVGLADLQYSVPVLAARQTCWELLLPFPSARDREFQPISRLRHWPVCIERVSLVAEICAFRPATATHIASRDSEGVKSVPFHVTKAIAVAPQKRRRFSTLPPSIRQFDHTLLRQAQHARR